MIRLSIMLLLVILTANRSFSQKPKEVTIKPGENPGEAFPIKDKYRFREFQDGYIITPEGKRTKPMTLNFNLFSELPQFINEKGDTLFVDEHIVKYVNIKGTLYLRNSSKKYYEIILNSNPVKIATTKYWKMTRIDTPYDHPEGGTETMSISRDMSNQVYSTKHARMIRNEYTVYRRDSSYFFITDKGKVYKATEANLVKLFPDGKKKISEYVSHNHTDFDLEDDLKALFERCINTLSK